ncbi:MAG: hypothetical protein K2X25_05680 [Caulobacteraceae bacterium]|nr:hypothetical protein [Caulobacteraceae bacterium]
MLTRRGFGFGTAAAGALCVSPVRAQTALTPEEQFHNEGRYLPRYLELKARSQAGDRDAHAFLTQYASFLSDEATAIGSDETARDPATPIADLSAAISRDALEAIVEAAASAQIVILNEAHNISGHRGFAARVMRALRPMGFDWFAAETFIQPQEDPAPSIRTYRRGTPFYSSLGYYSNDPVYAEMVREAARLGYRFADYEVRWDQSAPADADRATQIAAREEAQADNLIAAILRPDPTARVFVFCGYSHAMERAHRTGIWFAARLKGKTGIDPLTIEQSHNWPATKPENDALHVAAVLGRFQPTTPITATMDGQMLASRTYQGQMDMAVFHARLAPVAGRPGWLAADPERRGVEVTVPSFEGPTLLQAMHAGEGPAGVPADQFLLTPGQRTALLLLHPGSYFLRLERETGIDAAFGTIRVAG